MYHFTKFESIHVSYLFFCLAYKITSKKMQWIKKLHNYFDIHSTCHKIRNKIILIIIILIYIFRFQSYTKKIQQCFTYPYAIQYFKINIFD